MPAERRQHERIRIRAEVRLQQGAFEASLAARDLSLGGAYLAAGPLDGVVLEAGRTVKLTLVPDEDAPYHAEDGDGATFHASARVVRRDAAGVGLAFIEVDGDNQARLRALIEEQD